MNVAEVLQHVADIAPDSAHVVAEVRVGGPVTGHVVRVLHYPGRASSNQFVAELDGRELHGQDGGVRGWASPAAALESGIRRAAGSAQDVAVS